MARPEPPDPGLPLKLEPCSNGEFAPPPATPLVRRTIERTNRAVDAKARRLGLSRREFLRSSLGMTTMLSVLAACTRDDGQTGATFDLEPGTTTGRTSSTATTVDPESESESTMDRAAADAATAPFDEEFIFDVQNHLLEYPDGTGNPPGFPQSGCGEADPADCYGIEHFLELLFADSDTHMVMLSAIPFAPGALSPEVMERAMSAADRFGCADRVLMQGESFPTAFGDGGGSDVAAGLAAMTDVADRFPIRAFKTYTHTGGVPWRLDDDVGDAYLDHVNALGVPIVAVHKGLSGNDVWSSPADIGPAAAAHPEVNLLVYHSGYETSVAEGPYDPNRNAGVDRLITSVLDSGPSSGGSGSSTNGPPVSNVYAELGSTWRNLMGRPDEAAHLLGKLLVHLGEDNILWGTDSIWYGSPQDQIQLFRSFQISEEFQDRFGYPALTLEIKNKILGYNAARLFDVDPVTVGCDLDRDGLRADFEAASGRASRSATFHTHADAGLRAYRAELEAHRAW